MIAPRTLSLVEAFGHLDGLGWCADCRRDFTSERDEVAIIDEKIVCLACAEVHQVLEYYGRDLVALNAAMEWHLDAAKDAEALRKSEDAIEYRRQAGAISRAMTTVRRDQARRAVS